MLLADISRPVNSGVRRLFLEGGTKMKIRQLLFFLLTGLLIISPTLSRELTFGLKEYPIVYGKDGDGYPNTLEVHGLITEVSLTSSFCGLVRHAGTLKLKLQDKVKGYRQDYVYVAVPCFYDLEGEKKFLNKSICISVTKMDGVGMDGKACYTDQVINRINSRGIPFYCLDVNGEHLLEKVECDAK